MKYGLLNASQKKVYDLLRRVRGGGFGYSLKTKEKNVDEIMSIYGHRAFNHQDIIEKYVIENIKEEKLKEYEKLTSFSNLRKQKNGVKTRKQTYPIEMNGFRIEKTRRKCQKMYDMNGVYMNICFFRCPQSQVLKNFKELSKIFGKHAIKLREEIVINSHEVNCFLKMIQFIADKSVTISSGYDNPNNQLIA